MTSLGSTLIAAGCTVLAAHLAAIAVDLHPATFPAHTPIAVWDTRIALDTLSICGLVASLALLARTTQHHPGLTTPQTLLQRHLALSRALLATAIWTASVLFAILSPAKSF